jgi:hypothetical protein
MKNTIWRMFLYVVFVIALFKSLKPIADAHFSLRGGDLGV